MGIVRNYCQAGLHRGDVVVCIPGHPLPVVNLWVVAYCPKSLIPDLWRISKVTDSTTFFAGGGAMRESRQAARHREVILGYPVGLIRGGLANAEFDAAGAVVVRKFINPIPREPTPCPDHGGE